MTKYLLIGVIISLSASAAHGKMNVKKTIQQLKTNSVNSKFNLSEYQKNLGIASSNIDQLNKAISELTKEKRDLKKNAGNVVQNEDRLKKMEKTLRIYKADEEKKMEAEQNQIKTLQAAIAKLQANEQVRSQNIQSYGDKINQIETEKKSWGKQQSSLAEIGKALDKRKHEAVQERASWLSKRKSYEHQVLLWTKESNKAAKIYADYSRLND